MESCGESEFVDPRISGPLAVKRREKRPTLYEMRKQRARSKVPNNSAKIDSTENSAVVRDRSGVFVVKINGKVSESKSHQRAGKAISPRVRGSEGKFTNVKPI